MIIYHEAAYDVSTFEYYYDERASADTAQNNDHQLTNIIEDGQNNTVLAISGCIRGTTMEILYSELGLQSFCERL